MRWSRWLCLAVCATPSLARADIIMGDMKTIDDAVVVSAEVPPGKQLVWVNTAQGIHVVMPGVATHLQWKRRGGQPLHLRLVDAASVPSPLPEPSSPLLAGLATSGQACGEKIVGAGVFPTSSPADEAWQYIAVTITGETCDAALVRWEYRNKAGVVVEPGDVAFVGGSMYPTDNWPAPDGKDLLRVPDEPKPQPAGEVKPFPAPREVIRMLPPPGDTPAALRPHGCGCTDAPDGRSAVLGVLLSIGVSWRRRRLSEGTCGSA